MKRLYYKIKHLIALKIYNTILFILTNLFNLFNIKLFNVYNFLYILVKKRTFISRQEMAYLAMFVNIQFFFILAKAVLLKIFSVEEFKAHEETMKSLLSNKSSKLTAKY